MGGDIVVRLFAKMDNIGERLARMETIFEEHKEYMDIIERTDFNMRLNDREIQFTKADNERFVFEQNKIALDQSRTINFDAKVELHMMDRTKRWGISVGYSDNGMAYKLDFPVGGSNHWGGWLYKDDEHRTGGGSFKQIVIKGSKIYYLSETLHKKYHIF